MEKERKDLLNKILGAGVLAQGGNSRCWWGGREIPKLSRTKPSNDVYQFGHLYAPRAPVPPVVEGLLLVAVPGTGGAFEMVTIPEDDIEKISFSGWRYRYPDSVVSLGILTYEDFYPHRP